MQQVFLEILAFLGFTEGTKVVNEILGLVSDGQLHQAINNIANLGNKVSNKKVNQALLKLQQVPQIKTVGLQDYITKVQNKLENNYKDQLDLQSDIQTLNANVQSQMDDYANQSGLKRFLQGTADKEKELISKYKTEIESIQNKDNPTIKPNIEIEEEIITPSDLIKGYESGSKSI